VRRKITGTVGQVFKTSQGQEMTIIEYQDCLNVTVQFEDGVTRRNLALSYIKSGLVKNYYKKTFYSIGFLGEGKYKSSTMSYFRWVDILLRCYDKEQQEKSPSYKGCSVHPDWHNFQVFAKWFEENYVEGFEIDKDILVKGNKIYGPSTCCFVPKEINLLITVKRKRMSSLPTGLTKIGDKFMVSVNSKYKGIYTTQEEASQVYKSEKGKEIKILADKFKRQLTLRCYNALYNYQVE